MLTLSQTLPPGALLGSEDQTLLEAVKPTGGIWFSATPEALVHEGNAITGWRARGDATTAAATVANTGNSHFQPGPPAGLACTAGVQCGFHLPDFTPTVTRFSAAVIYSSPQNEAKTLLAVRTGASRNVIYLNETGGDLHATDRHASFHATLPALPERHGTRLAIISFTGRGIILSSGGKTASANGIAPEMDFPGQFLIGCRANRSGLAKTLGLSLLHDVFFWPDRAILASSLAEDRAVLSALDRFHRWAF